jgi:hypothetical protein
MEHTTGEGSTSTSEGTVRSGMHLHTGSGAEQSQQPASGHRRPEYATRLQGGVSQLSQRLNALLDDRFASLGPIQKYPLIAVGAAFALGLTLASGRRGPSNRNWMVERTRRQLRTLLIGTATAAIVSELHSLAESDERIRTLLGAYLGEDLVDLDDDEEEEDDFTDLDEPDDL